MKIKIHNIGDELGPEKILLLRQPRIALEAIVVVDNVACGPAIGGVRMAPDLTIDEIYRLSRAMTLKNAAAGLPHGGAKAGIIADPACSYEQKEKLMRTFARMIRSVTEYIPGPDMGTNEECMAWVDDEIGRAAGLPRVLGGIPLDEIGATGFGVAVAAEVAATEAGIPLKESHLAIQGFGAVGRHAANFLGKRGAMLVAVSDSQGAIQNQNGLDVDALIKHKKEGSPVHTFSGGQAISRDELVGIKCDIWIPAARPDVLTENNVDQLKARLVIHGANIPATETAEQLMHKRGILNIPDFIANAGGVICAAVEFRGGSESQVMETIEEKIRTNTVEILERSKKENLLPREAAVKMACNRVKRAMAYRRT
ncbi:glutamate dehydrogenase/leucine dehydrogenase [Candidatus Scalindua japonica]|uniref:Glutamate dehydrogenase n=1 Tax=Candidatus Scalindua japonica TaxID=1284222 RepID=A0A286TZX3_9BACT|nr:Glu/Leu/Phe/Val dehydrogenase [Candidatus Scalindua japonica]GAX61361.1 glutamate dehydrogenase/leucine dehydrogenase [Candidatus Scalindua japonica]